MGHVFNPVQDSFALLIFIISALVTYALYKRRQNTGIKALNMLIYLFISLTVLGFIEFTQTLFHDAIPFYYEDESTVPLIFSPVRLANIAAIIVLYLFAENILEPRVNTIRLSVMISLISGMIIIGFLDHSMGSLITTDLIIPLANNTRLDEFLFDILQTFVVAFVGYMFYQQYKFTDSKQYKRYIVLFLIAIGLYLFSMVFEVLEHVLDIGDINAFISAFPTIALLAYIYLRHPNLIYLVPTEVKFLQLVAVESGIPVYVAEFDEKEKKMEFLIGPGLSSIRTMLQELLTEKVESGFSLKSFEYNDGFLIFEESSGLFALLQADRLSKVLLTSLAYFITEFEKTFGDQLHPFKGNFKAVNGKTPDDLLRRCVPIVQAKPIISSLG